MPLSILAVDAAQIERPEPMLTTRAMPASVVPGSKAHHGVLATFRSLLEFLVVALFALTFILQPFRIPSASMVPTLRVGDFLMVDKQSYEPEGALSWLLPSSSIHRGDLVVFHYPVDPSMHLVKRVVAVPGDRVRLKHGRVWINGQPAQEPYAFYSPAVVDDFRDNFPSLRQADPSLDPNWWMRLRRSVVDGEISFSCWATTATTARTAGTGASCRSRMWWGGRLWCTSRSSRRMTTRLRRRCDSG